MTPVSIKPAATGSRTLTLGLALLATGFIFSGTTLAMTGGAGPGSAAAPGAVALSASVPVTIAA